MRIGIDLVSDTGRPSGIHSYTNGLLEALGECLRADPRHAGWRLVVFAHDDFEWAFPIQERPEFELVRTGRRGLGAVRRRAFQQLSLPALARRADIDLLHSFNNVLPLSLALPRVVTVHDLSPFVLPGRFGLLKRTFLRWAVPRSVERARAVVSISRSTSAEIRRRVPGVGAEKIETLHNGIDARFSPERDRRAEEELARRYDLPRDFLLYVGAAEPGKNLRGVTRALETLRRQHGLEIPWILAGTDGPHLDELERCWRHSALGARSLGRVDAEAVPHLYRMARAFVFPSLYEGFGLPLIEAFASGTPAVTSGGENVLREVAGRSACTVDPADPDDIARGILRVWQHEEVRGLLRARGLRRVEDFSWRRTAEGVLDIYERVAAVAEPGAHACRELQEAEDAPAQMPVGSSIR